MADENKRHYNIGSQSKTPYTGQGQQPRQIVDTAAKKTGRRLLPQPTNGQPAQAGNTSAGVPTSGQPTSGQPTSGKPTSGIPMGVVLQPAQTLLAPAMTGTGLEVPAGGVPANRLSTGGIPSSGQPDVNQLLLNSFSTREGLMRDRIAGGMPFSILPENTGNSFGNVTPHGPGQSYSLGGNPIRLDNGQANPDFQLPSSIGGQTSLIHAANPPVGNQAQGGGPVDYFKQAQLEIGDLQRRTSEANRYARHYAGIAAQAGSSSFGAEARALAAHYGNVGLELTSQLGSATEGLNALGGNIHQTNTTANTNLATNAMRNQNALQLGEQSHQNELKLNENAAGHELLINEAQAVRAAEDQTQRDARLAQYEADMLVQRQKHEAALTKVKSALDLKGKAGKPQDLLKNIPNLNKYIQTQYPVPDAPPGGYTPEQVQEVQLNQERGALINKWYMTLNGDLTAAENMMKYEIVRNHPELLGIENTSPVSTP